MYNLLVARGDAWKNPTYSYSGERFLEYTDEFIRARFELLTAKAISVLCSMPTLFAYESDIDEPARIGRITDVTRSGSRFSLSFEIDDKEPPIERDELLRMQGALGITDAFELMRTHWAIKDVDLPRVVQAFRTDEAAKHPYLKEKRVRRDANRIALKAVRSILDTAEPFDVSIEGTMIKVEAQRLPAEPWPAGTWGLDEKQDGPWPQPLLLDCSWPTGRTQVLATAELAGSPHTDLVSILLAVRRAPQQLVWINIAAWLREDSEETVPFEAWFSLSTRIPAGAEEKRRRAQRISAIKNLVRRSNLPDASGAKSNVSVFEVTLPDGRVLPSSAVALRRLTHLALLKLPFWMKDQADAIDGTPYLDPDDVRWASSTELGLFEPPTTMAPDDLEDEREAEEVLAEEASSEAKPVTAAGPARWFDPRLVLTDEQTRPLFVERRLEVPDALIAQLCAALSSGKHLLLVGPPGTGKTEIASALAEGARSAGYCNGAFVATASADWSTFDTIGGYALEKDGRFAFRPGVFLRAVEQRKWLLIDEVNRADIDRSFGELMTVLAGGRTDTPFTQPNGAAITVGPGSGESHQLPPTFRVIATMNTWDKTSLFRLSYAVQRRFAVVPIEPPGDAPYALVLESHAADGDGDPPLTADALERMKRLFHSKSLLSHRRIGPAVAIDMVRYQRRRKAGGDGLAEAVTLFLLPQLEGLDADAATAVYGLLHRELAGWAANEVIAVLLARFRELFPGATLAAT